MTWAALLTAGAALFCALFGAAAIIIELAAPTTGPRLAGAPPADVISLYDAPPNMPAQSGTNGASTTRSADGKFFLPATGKFITRITTSYRFGIDTARVTVGPSSGPQEIGTRTGATTRTSSRGVLLRATQSAWILGVQTGPRKAIVISWTGAGMLGFAAVLVLVTLLLAGPALKHRLRNRTGRCTQCGYDMSGLDLTTPCPECGHSR